MTKLSIDVKSNSKEISVIKAKRALMDIIVNKLSEYVLQVDLKETAEVIKDIAK